MLSTVDFYAEAVWYCHVVMQRVRVQNVDMHMFCHSNMLSDMHIFVLHLATHSFSHSLI
jgi:hypothetical protein